MAKARKWIVGGVGALVALILISLFFGAFASTPVDKIGLHYSGGPIDGTKFDGIVEPGSGTRFLGFLDNLILLPVTQRDYIVSLHPEEGDRRDPDSILAPAQGGVEMQFEVAAYFTLNTEPDGGPALLRAGVREVRRATTRRAGTRCSTTTSASPIEQAIQQQVRELHGGRALRGCGLGRDGQHRGGRRQSRSSCRSRRTSPATSRRTSTRILGGDYFCGPTFDRSKPDVCPDFEFQIISATPTSESVREAFADNAASRQAIITAQNNAQAKVAEAEGQRQSPGGPQQPLRRPQLHRLPERAGTAGVRGQLELHARREPERRHERQRHAPARLIGRG